MRKNKMCGIYKITNKINEMSYIGQSTDIKTRWNNHKSRYNKPYERQYNDPLYVDMRAYGLENFAFEVLEECTKKDLLSKEEYWIEYYQTYSSGYNRTHGGSWGVHLKLSDQDLQTITDLLTNTTLFNKEIAEQFGVSENIIVGINTGYYWHRDDIDYPIRKNAINKGREKAVYYCPSCGKIICKTSKLCMDCNKIAQRKALPINQDELYRLIKSYDGNFTAVGKLFSVSDNTIRKWCKQYNLPFHTSDYKPIKTPKQNAYRFIVNQIDKAGNIIGTYESIEEAHRVTGIHHIGQAANPNITSRKTAGGYYWEIVEKVQTNLKENS